MLDHPVPTEYPVPLLHTRWAIMSASIASAKSVHRTFLTMYCRLSRDLIPLPPDVTSVICYKSPPLSLPLLDVPESPGRLVATCTSGQLSAELKLHGATCREIFSSHSEGKNGLSFWRPLIEVAWSTQSKSRTQGYASLFQGKKAKPAIHSRA